VKPNDAVVRAFVPASLLHFRYHGQRQPIVLSAHSLKATVRRMSAATESAAD
jgi:hypothetical protein